MKDFYNFNNINKPSGKNDASITRIIRPGADDYDEIHNNSKTNDIPEFYDNTCNRLIEDDEYVDDFVNLYINKVNESIVSGKIVCSKAYNFYLMLREFKK